MSSFPRHLLIGVGVVLVQWLVLGRLDVYGAAPDAVLLYVLWMSLTYDRQTGSLVGFGAGLLMDLAYGTIGRHMFLKTLVGFFGSYIPASQRELMVIRPGQAFVGALVVALLHNGIDVLFVLLQTGSRSLTLITAEWLGGALYTALLAVLAAVFYNR